MSSSSSSTSSKRVDELISRMSIDELIGQMSQIDLSMLLEDDSEGNKQLNLTKVDYYIGDLGVGSVLNNVLDHRWNASQYRRAIIQLQEAAASHDHPPIIYGLDSIHGANYVDGATLVPQPINLAATFSRSMANRAGVIASRDTRAAGISWLFSPLVGIALNPYWSRVYETFGEDPYVVGTLALELIQGIQEPASSSSSSVPSRAAASAKHFVGYSMPHNGHDRAPSWIPTRHLYQYFLPPWQQVLGETLTVMEDYTEYNGVPTVANRKALETMLRFQLGFKGMVVTDYSEIWNLVDWHHAAASQDDAVVASLSAGVDMSMIPFDTDGFYSAVRSAVDQQKLAIENLRKHAGRVLAVKEKLGMFDETVTMDNNDDINKIGSDREEGLEMASQSIVMVKNNEFILPLSSKENLRVLITGPTADSLSFQSGGWTWQWQGPASNEKEWFSYGTTVLEAAQELPWLVSYQCGVDILGNDCSDQAESVKDTVEDWLGLGENIPKSIQTATEQDADYIIVCVGEENYTEKPGDINDLALPPGQVLLVRQLRSKKKNAKIILVYFGGRPRLLRDMEPHVDAILVAFLPGPDAGRAVVNIVGGSTNPSGKLPVTYPKYPDLQGVPYFHSVSDRCTTGDGRMPHYDYAPCQVQWPFGHGMSFTTFQYSNLAVSSDTIHYNAPGQQKGISHSNSKQSDSITVSVDVANTGSVSGYETMLFFTFDSFRSVTPEYKRLRAFDKIFLKPGESQTVTTTISVDDLRFVGPDDDSHYVVQDGLTFTVGVGAWTDCRVNPQDCSPPVRVVAGKEYVGACDAACRVWSKSACSAHLSSSDCWNRCFAASEEGQGVVKEGWGWPYVNCIESVATSKSTDCSKMTTQCRDIFATSSSISPPSTPSTVIGLTTGLVTAIMMFLAIRGDLARCMARITGSAAPVEDIEFQPVETADASPNDDIQMD